MNLQSSGSAQYNPQVQQLLRRKAELNLAMKARIALQDPYFWMTECTRTEDNQPKEGEDPFRPFPRRNYIKPILDLMAREPVLCIEKSRTMMASWMVAGYCAWYAFQNPATTVLFQSEDEDRAINLIHYVKVLWEQSLDSLKQQWRVERQSYCEFEMANRSHFYGVVGNPNKIRSLHPTIYVADEAAFMTQFEEAWGVAAGTRVPKMIALSSVQPGSYWSLCNEGTNWLDWPSAEKYEGYMRSQPHGVSDSVYDTLTVDTPCYGVALKRNPQGHAIVRLHIAADQEITQARVDEIKSRFPSEASYRQEVLMDAFAKSGQLIYPEFDAGVHVIDDVDIPRLLTRYMVVDPHPRTPFYALWIGVDRYDDWYVYRELWPSMECGQTRRGKFAEDDPQYTVRDYAETYAAMEGNSIQFRNVGGANETAKYIQSPNGEFIVYRLMDQAGKAFKVSAEGMPIETISSRFNDFDLFFNDPYKIHEAGEDAIRALLKPRIAFGKIWPKLHIAKSCKELIWEFQNLRYEVTNGSLDFRELKQTPMKVRSHGVDCMRYAACSDLNWIEVRKS